MAFLYGPWRMMTSSHIRAFATLMLKALAFAIAFSSTNAYALFWEGESLCGQEIKEAPVSSAISWITENDLDEVAQEAEPCSSPKEILNEADFSVCFEDAGAPMSTLPAAIAEMQSERASKHFANVALAMVREKVAEKAPRSEPEPPRAHLPKYALKAPIKECLSYEIECESAPHPMVTISLEMHAPINLVPETAVSFSPPVMVQRANPMRSNPGLRFVWSTSDVPTPPPNA